MKKTETLLLTSDYLPAIGGISILLSRIVRCLTNRGISVLTTSTTSSNQNLNLQADTQIIRTNFNVNVGNFRLPFELFKIFIYTLSTLKKTQSKVLLVGEVFPLGLIGLILKFFFRVRFITFSHGSDSLFAPNKIRNFLVGLIFRNADYVICFSDYTKGNLLKWSIQEERIRKVAVGIDTGLFSPGVDSASIKEKFNLRNRRVILTVNRLTPRKGIDTVINCLPQLIKEVPEILYMVIGEGLDKQRLYDLSGELNLEKHVLFVGEIEHEDLPAFFAASEIFVNAVREIKDPKNPQSEGFGLVNIEASACARAVIAGATGGVTDSIEDEKTGLLVNAGDKKELEDAILRLLKDKTFAKKLAHAGREKVLRDFRMKNMQSDLNTIWDQL